MYVEPTQSDESLAAPSNPLNTEPQSAPDASFKARTIREAIFSYHDAAYRLEDWRKQLPFRHEYKEFILPRK
jgi:hypothetical protein